jgi:LacI family transcriptional regulator
MTSIREVAERAGVSLGTVSNVLNRPEIVALETRERVQAVIAELGFVRNGSARQLRAGQSSHLGLVVLDVANPFFTDVARGVEDAANAAGYVVILCNSDGSRSKEERYLHVLQEQRTTGILITPVENDVSNLQRLRAHGIAVVLLDRPTRARDMCSVAVDDILGGELAGRHLLELGHRHIAYISGPLRIRQYAERLRGLRRAVKKAGLDPESTIQEITATAPNATAGQGSIDALLAHTPHPTAAFCANDLLALGVMRGLRTRGLTIPGDLALIGYDDVEFASELNLSTIRQPKYQLGYRAAELLLCEARQGEEHEHQQVMYEPELIVRSSTGDISSFTVDNQKISRL